MSGKISAALKPINITRETWMYAEKRGLLIVHEIRDARAQLICVEQINVPWSKIALAQHRRAALQENDNG